MSHFTVSFQCAIIRRTDQLSIVRPIAPIEPLPERQERRLSNPFEFEWSDSSGGTPTKWSYNTHPDGPDTDARGSLDYRERIESVLPPRSPKPPRCSRTPAAPSTRALGAGDGRELQRRPHPRPAGAGGQRVRGRQGGTGRPALRGGGRGRPRDGRIRSALGRDRRPPGGRTGPGRRSRAAHALGLVDGALATAPEGQVEIRGFEL